MLLSLVVPCFNEEAVLSTFHETIREELKDIGADVEICYVDDGSSDGTLRILRELAAKDPAAKFVSFSRNFGKEAAMLAGLEQATGDAVVIMDADLQHPPELIPRMLDLHLKGHDQVIARRSREGDKRFRSFLSSSYYKLVNRWVDVELVDGVGDFRLLSRKALDALLSMREYNRFSKGLYSWIGYDSVLFEYKNVTRELGQTKWSFGKLLNYALDGLISFNNRPLRVAIYFGLMLSALSLVYTMILVGMAIVQGVQTPGYITIIAAVTGLGGLQMTMLGLIGEYIGRIYYETKNRPHYLVRESTEDHRVPVPQTAAAVSIRETSADMFPRGRVADAASGFPVRAGGCREHRHLLPHLPRAAGDHPVPAGARLGLRPEHDRLVLHEHVLHLSGEAHVEEVPAVPADQRDQFRDHHGRRLHARLVGVHGRADRAARGAAAAIPVTFLVSRKVMIPGTEPEPTLGRADSTPVS